MIGGIPCGETPGLVSPHPYQQGSIERSQKTRGGHGEKKFKTPDGSWVFLQPPRIYLSVCAGGAEVPAWLRAWKTSYQAPALPPAVL
jgi:hypothetical protein